MAGNHHNCQEYHCALQHGSGATVNVRPGCRQQHLSFSTSLRACESMLVRATGDDPRTDHGAGKDEHLRDRQCDDRWMAYCIESLDQTQFEQKESTQQIADYKDMTEDYKDQLSNNRAPTKDSKGKRAASLGSGVSEEHSRSSINLTEELSQETSSALRLNELGPRSPQSRQQTPTRCVRYRDECSEISHPACICHRCEDNRHTESKM